MSWAPSSLLQPPLAPLELALYSFVRLSLACALQLAPDIRRTSRQAGTDGRACASWGRLRAHTHTHPYQRRQARRRTAGWRLCSAVGALRCALRSSSAQRAPSDPVTLCACRGAGTHIVQFAHTRTVNSVRVRRPFFLSPRPPSHPASHRQPASASETKTALREERSRVE